MVYCVEWILEYGNATDDIYPLLVKHLDELLHGGRSAFLGNRRCKRRIVGPERYLPRIIFDVDNDRVQLRRIYEFHERIAQTWGTNSALCHVYRVHRLGGWQMFGKDRWRREECIGRCCRGSDKGHLRCYGYRYSSSTRDHEGASGKHPVPMSHVRCAVRPHLMRSPHAARRHQIGDAL